MPSLLPGPVHVSTAGGHQRLLPAAHNFSVVGTYIPVSMLITGFKEKDMKFSEQLRNRKSGWVLGTVTGLVLVGGGTAYAIASPVHSHPAPVAASPRVTSSGRASASAVPAPAPSVTKVPGPASPSESASPAAAPAPIASASPTAVATGPVTSAAPVAAPTASAYPAPAAAPTASPTAGRLALRYRCGSTRRSR
jgi:hypothetical protein